MYRKYVETHPLSNFMPSTHSSSSFRVLPSWIVMTPTHTNRKNIYTHVHLHRHACTHTLYTHITHTRTFTHARTHTHTIYTHTLTHTHYSLSLSPSLVTRSMALASMSPISRSPLAEMVATCVCTYVCMYAYIRMHVCVCVCMCVCMYECMYLFNILIYKTFHHTKTYIRHALCTLDLKGHFVELADMIYI